ncbi:MAG: TRAP transporter large permease subunit, partial [Hyphomicrobiales bacterium]
MILTSLLLLIGLLALSLPVASALALLGMVLGELYAGMPIMRAMGETTWAANSDAIIVCVPLFILLGEILLRSGVAERMYDSMIQWMSWLPGGLMHSNIAACA